MRRQNRGRLGWLGLAVVGIGTLLNLVEFGLAVGVGVLDQDHEPLAFGGDRLDARQPFGDFEKVRPDARYLKGSRSVKRGAEGLRSAGGHGLRHADGHGRQERDYP